MKKKFSEIFAELNALEKVGPAALEEAKLAFGELSEEEQTTEKANLETLEAKPVEETQTDADKQAEADAAAKVAADEAAAKAASDAAAQGQGWDPLQASEQVETALFKETGLNLSQIKEMQKKFNEMAAAAKFAETEKKIDAFVFNESTNKNGIILSTKKAKFSEFAAKLPDALASEFFEILGSKSFKTMEFGEIGQDGNGGGSQSFEFAVPEKTPEGVSRESFVLDFVAKEFQTKEKGLKFEEAMFKALKAIEENGIK